MSGDAQHGTKVGSSAGARACILVVDDDATVRESLEILLRTDFEVASASTVQQAIGVMESKEFDVVIADYQLPGESGLELLRYFKTAYPDATGMLLTGHADLAQVKAAKERREVFYVLAKPFSPENLLRWTAAAVQAGRLRKSVKALQTSVVGTGSRSSSARDRKDK